MARGPSTAALRHLQRLFQAGSASGLSDTQLLERFLNARDGAAFEALVARHGPMVLGVCRHVVRNEHDAEDAFQASFLLLVEKAGSIRNRGTLAGWLFRVSYRLALRAKTSSLARRRLESSRTPSPDDAMPIDAVSSEDHAILHEEVNGLPEPYRAVVALCYLEGCTHDEAARQLGWPVGTVRGRLARARDRLRARLNRRGVTLSAVLALPWPHHPPVVPAPLAEATTRAVIAAAGSSGVTLEVMALLKGERTAMARSRLRASVTTLLAVGAVTAGLAAIVPGSPADQAPSPTRGASASNADDLDTLAHGKILRRIPVEQDAMVLAYLPQWNHGNVDNLAVADNGGGVRTLVRWGRVPPSEARSSNRRFLLALYSRRTTEGTKPGPIQAVALEGDWPERTSWDTQPATTAKPAAEFPFVPGEGWKLFDVTAIVHAQAERSGRGVMLRFATEDRPGNDWSGYALVSREGESKALRPTLLVVGASRPEPGETHPSRPSAPARALDANLTQAVDGRIAEALPVRKDVMVLAYLPKWNHGEVDNLAVADNDGGVRALVGWGPIAPERVEPPDRRFLLALFVRKTTAGSRTATVRAYEVRSPWTEGTSWETQPTLADVPGAEFPFTPGDGWKLFDVTPIIRAQAQSKRAAHGIALRFAVEDRPGNDWSGYAFVSREGEFAHLRPLLLLVDPTR